MGKGKNQDLLDLEKMINEALRSMAEQRKKYPELYEWAERAQNLRLMGR